MVGGHEADREADATTNAVETMPRSLRDRRVAEVQKLEAPPHFQTRLATRRKFSPRIPRTAASG
jgi:hypothetical protein